MVRQVCDVKVKDRVPSKELRDELGVDDTISVLQQNRLQWNGHVLRKEDNDWVSKPPQSVISQPGQLASYPVPDIRLDIEDQLTCILHGSWLRSKCRMMHSICG